MLLVLLGECGCASAERGSIESKPHAHADWAAKSAAREGEGGVDGCRDDGEERPVVVMHQVGALRKVGADHGALAVGEEWVVAAMGRERAFGQPDDDHVIEFEAERELELAQPLADRSGYTGYRTALATARRELLAARRR